MNKGNVSNLLRKLRLMHLTDRVRYYIQSYKNKQANKAFLNANPNIILPPDYLMYESFQINYEKYLVGGKDVADWIVNILNKYDTLQNVSILDWGCGPGRVIRHMPELLGNGSKVFGTDYNTKSITWCKGNLPNIEFNLNTLDPSLPYPHETFDFIYGISIFTHLSEEMHYKWTYELKRVLKQGGVLFLTTQGDNFKKIMSPPEIAQFNKGELVVRGNVIEGHRTYSAFHSDSFMRSLFKNDEILEVIIQNDKDGKATPQDAWVVRKQ
ncbi:MAG: SAM-dependent methyltransferase [Saprospiraceae bacterium]|jgi:SAM-dependent methyltransferase|tara:strand:- start:2472 stop:3275 length:804 start_codon:yes stop_codon:yes gene_type:complete